MGLKKNKHILPALRLRYPDLKFAYMIEWIPEQGEDIYYILVNSTKIAIVEVDRLNNSIDTLIIEIPLDDFLQRDIYDVQRFRIRAALELAGGIN